ncbi:MAG TPA: PilZ domain-containing protein [Deferrisomatales bacterium]|nr:PilZ domain-containing protein [Deferrisomatales bacterium]
MTRYERHRSRRCRVSLQAKYRTRGTRHHEGILYNLGEEGIFLCTDAALGAGTHLEITLRIPGVSEEVHAEGRVVWTNAVETQTLHAGMGIHFTNVDEGGRTRLREQLDSML